VKPFSFIHAADLHIDSPFQGVNAESPEVAEQLQKSTYQAFEGLIKACISHEVDFLLVAGDVYDGADRSLGSQLRFHEGLKRLAEAGIQSFVIHGNHDPLNGRVSSLKWPSEVKVFDKSAETVTVEVDGEAVAAVSGISFPKKEVRTNLSKQLVPGGSPDLFQIGLLHCNVGSDTGHDPYAPCELSDLTTSGMNYWALGHVHTRQVLSTDPFVVYPGNIQGRSIREKEARGCYLVKVDEQGKAELTFLPLDVIRWHETDVSIEGLDTVDALHRKLGETLEKLVTAAEERGVVCRLNITGRGPLYRDLHVDGAADELLVRIREDWAAAEPLVWVQRIKLACRPDVDLKARARQGDLLAEVLAVANGYSDGAANLSDLSAAALDDLWQNNRAKKVLTELEDDRIREILTEAELLCLDLLEDEE
jgi:exonuclease SbcD